MPPKQQRGEATIDRLLSAALNVYAESGHEGFTVQAVLKTSGISAGSLYHHFGNFDGLAAALYARCMKQLFEQMTTALARSHTGRTGVQALVTAYLRFTEEHADAALFLHASAYAGYLNAHAEEIRAVKEPLRQTITAWLSPRIAAGEIAPIPESLIEAVVIGPIAEVARRWLSSTYDADLDEAQRVLPELIWRSLSLDGR
ncbi:TetR/AcrR family transcriptional regulator [Streptomyces sp. NPDC018031]|uniref:TetR/AcrR family transcriptional regulator n=1 Tax=Streptomyces sp. NPDC018031 TaxID=3365033 RepID=UPI0037A482D5